MHSDSRGVAKDVHVGGNEPDPALDNPDMRSRQTSRSMMSDAGELQVSFRPH
jgi:hypothetical protein